MVLFLLIWEQLDCGVFPPVAELSTNLQVSLVKEIFGHVAVLCHQSGVKQQEEIIILAHNFHGSWVQRVLTPLNPHSVLETAEKKMAWAQIYPGHRKMCRFVQDILGWTGLKPASYKPRKSLFCLEQTAQILIYFFHWKAMVGLSNLLQISPDHPEKRGIVENQHSKEKTCRGTAFIKKTKVPAGSHTARRRERVFSAMVHKGLIFFPSRLRTWRNSLPKSCSGWSGISLRDVHWCHWQKEIGFISPENKVVLAGRGPRWDGMWNSVNGADSLGALFSPLEVLLPFLSQGKLGIAWFYISDR